MLVAGCLARVANAAEITRVASSFEARDPFGMFLDVAYVRTQELARIDREGRQQGTVQDMAELRYVGVDSRLDMAAHVGIWRDLELSVAVPLVFAHSGRWGFARGTTAASSTVTNNCLNANGSLVSAACPDTGDGRTSLFPVPGQSFRGGVGDLRFGVAWGVFKQAKDDTKPDWVLGFDYQAPTASRFDPSVPTDAEHRGRLGDRVQRFTPSTALSRKLGIAEPYVKVSWTLPALGHGTSSNCDHPNPLNQGAPDNCNVATWTRKETGLHPATEGHFIFGTELNAYDEPSLRQRFAIDLQGILNYVGPGRYDNELSSPLGKLLSTGEYLQAGGAVTLVAQASEVIGLRAAFTLLYSTPHPLTQEQPGKDLNGNGTVDRSAGSVEANPNFDDRIDLASRRFRIAEVATFRFDFTATFRF